jgi:hypothetical protein
MSTWNLKSILGLPFLCCTIANFAFAEERAPSNMKYQVGWVAMGNAVTANINRQAANGWKLKSASMTQCPTREPAKTFPCVMVIMEKEDK